MIYQLSDRTPLDNYKLLTTLVAPRPIALVSTVDAKGRANLSPFSFFNLFSADPPIVIFSVLRRMRDNRTKDTLENILAVPEVVIHLVTEDIAAQSSLASGDYPRGIDEFKKAGFSKEKAKLVAPPMVVEAKIKLECAVSEVKPLGDKGGAGNLIICEVLIVHLSETAYGEDGSIDIKTLNLAARMGGDYYTKADKGTLFELPKPGRKVGIGVDALPFWIWSSDILSGHDLAILSSVSEIPGRDILFYDKTIFALFEGDDRDTALIELQHYLKKLLRLRMLDYAWQVVLYAQNKIAEEAKIS